MMSIASSAEYRAEIKKSRFVAKAASVESPDEALAFLKRVSEADATHNCWAYKVGQSYRFSDDGEPAGTAGRPILSAIESQGLDHVVVVVTRHFGGVKLGAGGLVRAYGAMAAGCLRRADRKPIVRLARVIVTAPFDAVGGVHATLSRWNVRKIAEEYADAGARVHVEIDEKLVESFSVAVMNATGGRATAAAVSPAERSPGVSEST